MQRDFSVVIVGGGTAGLTVASRLKRHLDPARVAIVEPSERHLYQPLFTLVGGGVFPLERAIRAQADYIPKGQTWIRDRVTAFEPEENRIRLASGQWVGYEQLVVAAGIQLDWEKIEGLMQEHLGKDGLASIYSPQSAAATWKLLQDFEGGTAVFTFPSTPVKCAGAPQKIMYLADDHLRRAGVRDESEIVFASAGQAIFGVPKYAAALKQVVARKGIDPRFGHDLVAVRPASREAIFRTAEGEKQISYDLLHVVPPQSAPAFIQDSPLASEAGWVDVDKHTLQHRRFANVFSLGDCSSLPTSKTGAAVRAQAPVLVRNLLALRRGEALTARYDGYTSCPLVTGYGKLILAEFDYDGNPRETFPFDQAKERASMYLLKAYGLPALYWNGMLRGRA